MHVTYSSWTLHAIMQQKLANETIYITSTFTNESLLNL